MPVDIRSYRDGLQFTFEGESWNLYVKEGKMWLQDPGAIQVWEGCYEGDWVEQHSNHLFLDRWLEVLLEIRL